MCIYIGFYISLYKSSRPKDWAIDQSLGLAQHMLTCTRYRTSYLLVCYYLCFCNMTEATVTTLHVWPCICYLWQWLQILMLTVTEFATESCCDFLYIYDGDNLKAPLLASLSGSLGRRSYNTTQRTTYIRFISDDTITDRGFSANYQSTTPGFCHHLKLSNFQLYLVCNYPHIIN